MSEKTHCKACGKPTKNGNKFCTPEEGRNWTEDPETEFKCEECGHEWKLKESATCPKCDPDEEKKMNKKEFKEKLKQLIEEAKDLPEGDLREAFDEVMGF